MNRLRLSRLITLIAAVLATALVSRAEPPSAASAPAITVNDVEKGLLTIDYPNQQIGTILSEVARTARLNLVIDSEIQGRTSLKLRNVTWRQIFREVLTPVGCTYIESAGLVRVINLFANDQTWTPDLLFPQPDNGTEPRLSVSFTNAPASEVLRHIAKTSGIGLVIPRPLDFRVTVRLEGTTWRPAFRAILNAHGYTFSENDLGDGAVTIRPRPPLPETDPARTAPVPLGSIVDDATKLLPLVVFIPLAMLHLVFATGVARQRLGRPTVFLPKTLWVLFILGGGIVPLLAYWLFHHSTLAASNRNDATVR